MIPNVTDLLKASNTDMQVLKSPPIRISGEKTSFASLPEVSSKQLLPENMYATAELVQDDDGQQTVVTDIILCHHGKVLIEGTTHEIGGGKGVFKLVRFLKSQVTKRLSEVPGVHFYGPFTIDPPNDN